MFSRKKRSYSQPLEPQKQPPRPSSAASVAANAAFLSRRSSNASLSSAAAAAALRSHTTSPTPIGDLQTKRMVRRNSNSSVTSASNGNRQPFSSGSQNHGSTIGRRTSVSSMSERSFRSPSPGPRNRPPVPALPENIPSVPALRNQQASKRYSSVEPPYSRLASPPPGSNGTIPHALKTDVANKSESNQPSPTTNFSRPMSPSPQSTGTRTNLVGRPASSLGFTQDDVKSTFQRPEAARQLSNSSTTGSGMQRAATTAMRPSNATGKPTATPDEIKAFQARAASLLARPRSEAYAPVPVAAPKKVDRTSSILKSQGPPPAPSTQSRQQPASTLSATTRQHARTGSQPISGVTASIAGVSRSLSVSPARSAHFSDRPVTEGTKHIPPNRGISPAKSVLKTSRPTSPAFSSSKAASDTSDARSLLSEDGGTGKKKKSVRVSFEENPLTVGEAATPQSPINTIISPQNRKSPVFAFDADSDAGMGAKPVLPSFASVRSPRRVDEDSPSASPLVRKAREASISDEMSESTSETAEAEEPRVTVTTASLAPAIAIQPATPGLEEQQQQFDSPRTPEFAVSQPAASGRHSLEDELSAEHVNDVLQSSPTSSPKTSPTRSTFTSRIVHPTATSASAAPQPVATLPSTADGPTSDSAASTGLGVSRDALQTPHDDADVRTSSDYDEESEEDWSDAAEDPSEMDQRGYASLDAILESPGSEANSPPTTSAGLPEGIPLVPIAASVPSPTHAPAVATSIPHEIKVAEEQEDWDKVRAYWSSLSEHSKQQMEAAATPLPDLGAATKKPASKKKLQTPDGLNGPSVGAPLPPWPDQDHDAFVPNDRPSNVSPQARQILAPQTTPLKSALKSSMRGSPAGASMAAPPKASPKQRPQSASAASPTAIATAYNTGRPKSNITKPALQRSASNDSNSSQSSFRKSRRDPSATRSDGGKAVSMRRSMRAGPAPKTAPQPRAQPAARPMSPELSGPRVSMRHSMRRNSMESLGGRSATSTTSQKSFSRIFGFGKSKERSAPAPRSQSMNRSGGNKFKSRFGDDSDSDDGGRSTGGFRSRFADSDDSDDERIPPMPTMLPRTTPSKKERAMADLEADHDEIAAHGAHLSADRNPEGMQVPLTAVNVEKANAEGAGAALASGTLRKGDKKDNRRSFFSFGKKHKKTESTVGDLPQSPQSPSTAQMPASPRSPTVPSEVAASPIANGNISGRVTVPDEPPSTPPSAIRPATATPGKASAQHSRARSSSRVRASSFLRRLSSSAPSSPNGAPTAINTSIIPYPQIPPIPDHFKEESPLKDRPNTSDGVASSSSTNKQQRPALGAKRDSAMTAPSSKPAAGDEDAIYSMRTGKKKKFQGLRKKLGLYD